MRLLLRIAPLLLLAALGQACSRSISVELQPAAGAEIRGHDRILVVGLSSSLRRRDRWETVMVDTLRRQGFTAWTSLGQMDSGTDIDRDSLGRVVEKTGAELVLVTRLVDEQVHATAVEARTGVKTQRRSGTPVVDFFRYDYKEYEEPGYVLLSSTVRLHTDVFETREGRLLAGIDSVAREQDSEFELLAGVTEAITRRLRRAGLLRPAPAP